MNDKPKPLSYLEKLSRSFNTIEQSRAKRAVRDAQLKAALAE